MEEENKVEEVKEETPLVPSGNKGSNKTIISIMGVVIVALVVVLLVVLLGGKDKNSNSDNKEETNTENTEVEPDKPDETDSNAVELDFAQVPCGSVDFTIESGTVTVENISVHDKLGMLSTALLEIIGEDKLNNLTTDTPLDLELNILEVAKQYFEVTPDMEKQIEEGFGTGFYLFSQKNNKATLELIIGGCIGPGNDGYYIKYKDSKKEKNTLVKTYYYFYEKNSDAIEKEDGTLFPVSYYKLKEDSTPVYKDLLSEDTINYDSFNTLDVYFDTSNGNMKLTKVVFNTK